jgi:hypothetical protein
MEPIDYIKRLGMNEPGICDKFSRPDFLRLLDIDFKERIDLIESNHEMSYIEFKDLVREFEGKFRAISDQKAGLPLTKNLWNAFYARFIIPYRAKYFPLTHRRILTLVEKKNRENQKQNGKN